MCPQTCRSLLCCDVSHISCMQTSTSIEADLEWDVDSRVSHMPLGVVPRFTRVLVSSFSRVLFPSFTRVLFPSISWMLFPSFFRVLFPSSTRVLFPYLILGIVPSFSWVFSPHFIGCCSRIFAGVVPSFSRVLYPRFLGCYTLVLSGVVPAFSRALYPHFLLGVVPSFKFVTLSFGPFIPYRWLNFKRSVMDINNSLPTHPIWMYMETMH